MMNLSQELPFPCAYYFAEIGGVNTCAEIAIELVHVLRTEIVCRLMEGSHDLALDNRFGFLIIGCAVLGISHM